LRKPTIGNDWALCRKRPGGRAAEQHKKSRRFICAAVSLRASQLI
jgi:hypothetical protein